MVYQRFIKPVLDITLAALLFLVLSPLLFIISFILVFVNHGSPFFLQIRPGQHGKPFRIIKFKTMNDNLSIVGPRPLLMEYLPFYNKEQSQRHKVKPGITGWAQVNGRQSISFTQRFILDVWYVKNISFKH